ncbi:MAG: hypothetical protein IKS35_01040 [Clostridia bacterium]|nr:hypothetical protein [Clostridia bacterium]
MEQTIETEHTAEDKRKELFLKQKHTLDLFLEKGAISQQQYNKSLHDLAEKMGFPESGKM